MPLSAKVAAPIEALLVRNADTWPGTGQVAAGLTKMDTYCSGPARFVRTLDPYVRVTLPQTFIAVGTFSPQQER
jgi:hypothetical protein